MADEPEFIEDVEDDDYDPWDDYVCHCFDPCGKCGVPWMECICYEYDDDEFLDQGVQDDD